jgi:hypothetical protein
VSKKGVKRAKTRKSSYKATKKFCAGVHANEKKHSRNNVKVDIYLTAMGMVDFPTEQEIAKLTVDIQKNPQKFRIVA